MIVLGFSGIENGAFYRDHYKLGMVGHDAAAALIRDGQVVFAAEEERFTRRKHEDGVAFQTVRAALQETGLEPRDIDLIAYPWNADLAAITRMFVHHPGRIPLTYWPSLACAGARVIRDLMNPGRAVASLAHALGSRFGQYCGVKHHLAHAACAYFTSTFTHAAVLTLDGQGEDESASLGEWEGTQYRKFQSIPSPDSIGILYGMITDFMGMRSAADEYKVMGMAAYGDAQRFQPAFKRLVRMLPDGRYRTWRTAMVFAPNYCHRMLSKVLNLAPRRPDMPIEQIHFDLAAALQKATEEVVFHLLRRLRALSKANDICLAGGVFQNSVINGKILSSGLFRRVHVPPIPGDHGSALGAAVYAYHAATGTPRVNMNFSPFCGPAYTATAIRHALTVETERITFAQPEYLVTTVAARLADGEVLGWFQGRMEYGPRALGHRSILADPRNRDARDRVNARVKHREPFRPFAGVVPREHVSEWFVLDADSPFMQFVVPLQEPARANLAALDHFGTCRVQTVTSESDRLLHGLLLQFGRVTGVPVLLNTSFNDADEPIVCTPAEALHTFLATDLDGLVIGPYLVTKR